jgi:spore germination protein GerM
VVRLGAGLLVAVLGGCAVSTDGDARRVRPSAVPFELLDPEAPPLVPPSSGPTTQEVSLCFVRDGRLVVASLDLPPPVTLGSAVAALAAPPQALRPTVRTALTDPAIIRDVRVSGGIARVDLSASVSSLPADQQLLAVAQIVCTLTGRPGIGQVSFALEGAPLAVPNAEGSLVTTPVARDDYRALLG